VWLVVAKMLRGLGVEQGQREGKEAAEAEGTWWRVSFCTSVLSQFMLDS
jgi:hypothetical protein